MCTYWKTVNIKIFYIYNTRSLVASLTLIQSVSVFRSFRPQLSHSPCDGRCVVQIGVVLCVKFRLSFYCCRWYNIFMCFSSFMLFVPIQSIHSCAFILNLMMWMRERTFFFSLFGLLFNTILVLSCMELHTRARLKSPYV